MKPTVDTLKELKEGKYNKHFSQVYVCDENYAQKYAQRYIDAISEFQSLFDIKDEIALFSAPGRTEIGGNHTDHQHGCVLAGSVNIDVIAVAAPNGTDTIRIKSKGYNMDEVDVNDLDVNEAEYDKAISLIRGVARKFRDLGYKISGFDAYTTSDVMKGSGLSSSAAFEVLVGTIINGLFANSEVSNVDIAKFGQYAENVYYNKPSGLMDQMASAVGSVVSIDFGDSENPVIKKVNLDLKEQGYALCIIDSGADHADLTDEYASVPSEMKEVAKFFGKEYLREVDENEFYANIKAVRESVKNDRAILRAMHFINDNRIAQEEARMLGEGDFEGFLELVKKSGRSSFMYLQNVYASSMPKNQAVSLTIAMCEKLLKNRGAYRVHGGGFAGTVQAFVPTDMLNEFKVEIEKVLGEGMCHILSIRPVGGYEVKI
ncbi:MAG: galactokinase [Clostridia bacterium]|nr:galactokinase [Clostridia bacterium]